jgi:hypothetical protein
VRGLCRGPAPKYPFPFCVPAVWRRTGPTGVGMLRQEPAAGCCQWRRGGPAVAHDSAAWLELQRGCPAHGGMAAGLHRRWQGRVKPAHVVGGARLPPQQPLRGKQLGSGAASLGQAGTACPVNRQSSRLWGGKPACTTTAQALWLECWQLLSGEVTTKVVSSEQKRPPLTCIHEARKGASIAGDKRPACEVVITA